MLRGRFYCVCYRERKEAIAHVGCLWFKGGISPTGWQEIKRSLSGLWGLSHDADSFLLALILETGFQVGEWDPDDPFNHPHHTLQNLRVSHHATHQDALNSTSVKDGEDCVYICVWLRVCVCLQSLKDMHPLPSLLGQACGVEFHKRASLM